MIKYKNITILITICFSELHYSTAYLFKLNTNLAIPSIQIYFLQHLVGARNYDLFGVYFNSQSNIMIYAEFD